MLTGGTSLDVQYYTYKGQNYYSAQDLLDVLGNEDITGTVDIPLVAADGSSRVAKYVVTDRGRTLKHPYKITLNNSADGTTLFDSTSTSGSTEYFYASDGFPMSNITTTTVSKNVNGTATPFPITAWNINGTIVAADGTLIGFGEGTTLEAAPVTSNFMVDSNGMLSIADDYINACAAAGTPVKIPASVGTISSIANTNLGSVALDLSEANIVDSSGNALSTWTAGILDSACASTLTSIKLPNSITSIGTNAFENYSNLQSVTLPNSVATIGDGAFKNCSQLSSIDLSNVTSIGEDAFHSCAALTSVNLSNVTSFGDKAFNESGLTSIEINANATVGTDCFNGCSIQNITFLTDSSGNANFAFSHCSFGWNTAITSIVFPPGNYAISVWCCGGCTNLSYVEIKEGVTEIGSSAFVYCPISNIIIPTSVTAIEGWAFDQCGRVPVTYLGTKAEWDANMYVASIGNSLRVTTSDGITFNVN